MALGTTIRRAPARRAPASPTAELTIEEARQQYDLGSQQLVLAEIKELERLEGAARELTNTANRQKTKVKGAFKSYALVAQLTPEDELQFGEQGYRYDVNYSEKYDVEGLYKMLKDGKITDGEFLRSISVNKAEADKAIGPHKLLQITKITPGKSLDLRSRKLDQPVKTVQLIRTTEPKVAEKLNMRGQDAPPKKTATTVSKLKPVRKLKLKR